MKKLLTGFSGLPRKTKVLILSVLAALIALCATYIVAAASKQPADEVMDYNYNRTEQQLADETIVYLKAYLPDQPDKTYAQIADAAVQNYNIIMASDVDLVNDDHTEAIKQQIRSAMAALTDDTVSLTDDDLDGISSGVAQIIWNTILGQIETSESDYRQEYLYLSESIQEQINRLEERKMKVSIHANIKSNADMTAEELLAMIEGMTDEELQEFLSSLGLSYDELYDLLASANRDTDKALESRLETLKKELLKELTNELSASDGTNGTAGKNGQDGQDGQDGKNGTDGLNGKTTYIAYADDASGSNFSLTPLETSKYIGTCISDAAKQPTDQASYSNWQPYRSHIITETTDENGVTTVHIH